MDSSQLKKRVKKEIVGVLLLGSAIFLLISFLSYNLNDPSFNHYINGAKEVKNLGGTVGSYLSDIFFRTLGFTSYILPITFLIITLKLFITEEFKFRVLGFFGYVIFILSLSAVLALMFHSMQVFGYPIPAGGFLGTVLSSALEAYFNREGAYLLLFTLIILSFMIVTNFSLILFLKKAGNIFKYLTIKLGMGTGVLIYRERKRRKESMDRRKKKDKDAEINGPAIIDDKIQTKKESRVFIQEGLPFLNPGGHHYSLPPLSILDSPAKKESRIDRDSIMMNSKILEKKLEDFGVQGRVKEVLPGPVITRYEFEPAAGIKISKIVNLSDDLALVLRALSVRIVAPVPGKAVVGIEIPNQERETVLLRDILTSDEFQNNASLLTLALGKDISGNACISDLASMPHLLIAGATGAGKSVSLNAMICSILFKAAPEEIKLIMVDPKRLELSHYEGIPHLLHPVVTDPKDATGVLTWATREMERRYQLLQEKKSRNIKQFNKKMSANEEKLPYIVIVIDELADLMMTSSKQVETEMARLAQMARAAGIHLLVATQRPSVDILTGTIKANFPARISFQVSSKTDSRTILDNNGAEHLLGAGDMLFMSPGTSKITRVHGAFISENEIKKVVDFLKQQGNPVYDNSLLTVKEEIASASEEGNLDERYDDAVALVAKLKQASISLVQRHLRIGYNRAARIIERMEQEGIVSPADGSKPREVLIRDFPGA